MPFNNALDSAHGSVTAMLGLLQSGNRSVVDGLWNRYFSQMVRVAERRLTRREVPYADGEDVALSAFHSFCARAMSGRFPALSDRECLWSLLMRITINKAIGVRAFSRRLKRGGSSTRTFQFSENDLAHSDPPPDVLAAIADTARQHLDRLDSLGDPKLRVITQLALEGYTSSEIAARLGCVQRTIEFKMKIIRQVWSEPDRVQ